MTKWWTAALAGAAMTAAVPVTAATQVVNGNGTLTGATGVMVNGMSYDVRFVEGTCSDVFGVCSQQYFDFRSTNVSAWAAQSLLDQVFLDTSLGEFDSNPALTFGCSSATCNVIIPFASTGSSGFFTRVASNREDNSLDNVFLFGSNGLLNTNAEPTSVFARFSLSPTVAAVPEPTSWALMLFGFGVIGSGLRSRRRMVGITAI